MSKTIGPFRHTGTVSLLGPRGFEPARGQRDAVARKSTPKRKATSTRAPHLDAVARNAKAAATAATAAATRLNDSLDRLKSALETVAEGRRHRAAAARDADLSALARYQGVSPADVNAANRARWGRA